MNATQHLHDLGQSLWLDNITRGLLTSGTLGRYIRAACADIPGNPVRNTGIRRIIQIFCSLTQAGSSGET